MEKRKIGVDGRQDRNRKKDEWRKNGKRGGDMKGVGFVKENEVKVAKNDEKEKKTRSFYEKKKREDRKSESSRLWVEDARDSIYRGQSNEPLGVLIT